jgi:hypothetical protein
MDGEKLLLHMENLVPGFVTLALLASNVSASLELTQNAFILEILRQPFVAGVIVTALAYLIGSIVFVASRLLVDTGSLLTFRPLFLKLYRWSDFDTFNPIKINRKYREAIDKVLQRDKDDAIRYEVISRRQRGRLIRTALVPALLIAWRAQSGWLALLALLAVVAIYAYAEVAIYQEARLAA